MIVVCYILGVLFGLLAAWRILISVYAYHNKRLLEVQHWRLDLKVRELALASARTVYPDQSGTFPLLLQGKGERILDPGRGLLYTLGEGLIAATAEVARPEQMRRLLQGAGGWPPAGIADNLLGAGPVSVQWPTEIPLKSVVTEPDIGSLVLGVTANETGMETVRADMGKLVHIAVGGSSGWGKSVFLRSLAYQLALSQSPVDLVMVDLEGATLAPFARCARLLYPVADTEKDALAVLGALTDELERRKELYARYPGVDSLGAYNTQGDEPLTPLVALVDEATALLGDKSTESVLRTLALRARKYGLWLVMAGQDWKANSLDTAIRNQLSSRVQFKAMSSSQSRVLLMQGGAEELDVVGRALVILPGREMFTMQSPFVSARTIMADCSDGGAQWPMPETDNYDADLVKRVKALYAEGLGLCDISDAVFGYHNARKTGEIKDILGLDS